MGDRRQAVDFYNRGVAAELDKSDPANVERKYQLYSSAVTVDPTLAEAWFKVGYCNGDDFKHPAASIAAWRRTLELPVGADPGDLTTERKAQALSNMGHHLYQMGRHKEAREAVTSSLHMKESAISWFHLAMIQSVEGEDADAIASARRAYELDPVSPQIELQLGLCLMWAGKYAEGLKHYEARFPYKLKSFEHYPYPKWDGSEGKTLFLMSDQGLGDTLSFARFLPEAAKRCKFVHAVVHGELLRLFRAAFQNLTNVDFIAMGSCGFLPADCWSTFVSLPHHLGLTDAQIVNCPGLPRPQFTVPKVWKSSDRKLHIGISWTGSPFNDNNKWRTIPIQQFLELYRVPGIQLYSLQVGEFAKQVHDEYAAVLIRDLSPYIKDVADTTAIVNDLDLIITCESALGHIAAMMGKKTWIPLAKNGGDYRCQRHGDHPIWYRNTTLFRQGDDAAWGPVFERIVAELSSKVASEGP